MNEVVLRPARPADAEALAVIHQAARRAAMPWLPELHDLDAMRAWMAGTVLAEAEVWAADAGGQVVGYLALRGDDLDQLYLAPDHQGQGIGSRLLAHAKALCPRGLSLYAFQKNTRARAFYEGRGFVPARFSDGADNEEQEPDVLYRWPGEA